MSSRPEELPSATADLGWLVAFCRQTLAIAQVEFKKLFREPTELVSRAVQPILWLVVFGEAFSHTRGIDTGKVPYLDFMSPGILAQSVLFSAIFFGIAVIWERDLGIVHKLLVSPAYRSSLVLGKAISAGFRGLVQAVIVFAVAAALGVDVRLEPLAMLGLLTSVMMGSAIFSTFSLVVACMVKTREKFMGIGQVLTMPLFFVSNAIYPLSLMPVWLAAVARFNPLTYLVDALREEMIKGGTSVYGLATDYLVMGAVLIVLVAIAARLYPTLVR